MSYEELLQNAVNIIKRSRDLTERMMEEKFIPEAPEE